MKKPKRPKKKQIEHASETDPQSIFFLSFIGEYVEITCRGPMMQTEIGMFPLIAQGYLLDIDEKHLYLSDDGHTVARALKKDDYISIEIVKQKSEMEQRLENLAVPDDTEKGH